MLFYIKIYVVLWNLCTGNTFQKKGEEKYKELLGATKEKWIGEDKMDELEGDAKDIDKDQWNDRENTKSVTIGIRRTLSIRKKIFPNDSKVRGT